jgi:hypothetical protein
MMAYDAVIALRWWMSGAKADLFTGPGSSRSFKQVEFDGATGRFVRQGNLQGSKPETVAAFQML